MHCIDRGCAAERPLARETRSGGAASRRAPPRAPSPAIVLAFGTARTRAAALPVPRRSPRVRFLFMRSCLARSVAPLRSLMTGHKRALMKIGTHSGSFHCDEAFGCFLLKQLPEYKDAEIVRSRDPAVLDECDVVIDVGGVYDPGEESGEEGRGGERGGEGRESGRRG